MGSKAVGDLAEHDAGTQGLLRAVVGRRDGAVGDENEQVLTEALEDALEFPSRLGGGNDREQGVDPGLEAGVISGERGVRQFRSAPADANGSLQQGHDPGRQGIVSSVKGVLDVAQQVGETDLVLLGRPADLRPEAVGNPEGGTDVAEERRDDRLAPRGANDEAGAIAVMEDPDPEGPPADPHRCLVRLQDGAGQQAATNGARLGLECRGAVLEHVG